MSEIGLEIASNLHRKWKGKATEGTWGSLPGQIGHRALVWKGFRKDNNYNIQHPISRNYHPV